MEEDVGIACRADADTLHSWPLRGPYECTVTLGRGCRGGQRSVELRVGDRPRADGVEGNRVARRREFAQVVKEEAM